MSSSLCVVASLDDGESVAHETSYVLYVFLCTGI